MPKTRSFQNALAFLIVALFSLGAAVAVAQQNAGMGSLAEFLPPSGQDGAWRIANAGDSFELENTSDPNAIKYFYTGFDAEDQGRRTIETALSIHPDSQGAAGLIYGLDAQSRSYHLLTLGPKGEVTMFRRDAEGFRPLIESQSSAFLDGQVNRLRIEENGDTITFYLNDAKIGEVGGDKFGRGHVGIAAIGAARVFYNSFLVNVPGKSGGLNPATQPANATTAGPEEALQFRRVEIIDEAGPAGRMLAYKTIAPANWKTQGGIFWSAGDSPNGCYTGGQLIWSVATPDQSYGLAFFDPLSWGVSSYGSAGNLCVQQDLPDAEAAARAYLQNLGQHMQVDLKQIERPPEIKPLVDVFASVPVSILPGVSILVDGVVASFTAESGGVRNDVALVLISRHTNATSTAGGSQYQFRIGRTALVLALFTPEGKLEEGHPAFGVILNNLRATPEWLQVTAKWWADRGRNQRPTSGTASSGGGSIGDMMFESWKKREGIKDAGQKRTVNSIWEVQPYKTTGGDSILLNQNYSNAWELQDGSIVMTNDQFFNPVTTFNQTGQAMQPGN